VHGSTVLYPSDPNQTAQLVAAMADTDGISYLRTTREALPALYEASEQFKIGGARVVRQSDADDVTVIGAGITLHEALAAADTLAEEGISVRVVDLYSLKPVDAATLRAAAEATDVFVTVEDHWAEGGIGDAVLDAIQHFDRIPRVKKLAVTEMPGSATPRELLHAAKIDRDAIADAVRALQGART
jgi:transketolase